MVFYCEPATPSTHTCFVRAEDNFWYYCDDAAQPERQSSMAAVLGHEAYMLLYERR